MLHAKCYVLHVTYDMLCTSFIIFGKQGTKSFARDFFTAAAAPSSCEFRVHRPGSQLKMPHPHQGFSLDFHFSIFPFWGMRKMNQFPLAEKDFPTNFQKITKMGMEI